MTDNTPTLYTMAQVARAYRQDGPGPHCSSSKDGKNWYPARPQGFWSLRERFRVAWKVFRGRADAFTWPGGQ